MVILSLEELMKRFDLPRLLQIHNRITIARDLLKGQNGALGEEEILHWKKLLKEIESYCYDVHFHHAGSKAFSIHLDLATDAGEFTGATLAAHFDGLREDINICMFAHKFVQVIGDDKGYLEAKSLFGKVVVGAFPNVSEDVQDAGDCIAVGLNTAAVFHLMHVVEWGLRALCKNLKVSKINSGPVEYATWDDILKKLPDVVAAKINAMSRGPKKQKAQEFYYAAMKDIRGFKDAWRNHIMHTRRSYTREDALGVWSHVQRFMQGLAAYGVKDV